jgi:voltage-gated potassium channel
MSPEFRQFRQRLIIPLAILAVTHVLGTLGFWWVWQPYGASVMDALFMTYMTVTTLGYEVQYPLGTAGRFIAMLVGGAGIGTLFFTFGFVMDFVVNEGLTGARRRSRMQKTLDGLEGHFILAGLGRVGREAAAELDEAKAKWVLVDPNEDAVRRVVEAGGLAVKGDATEDAVLRRAGIERAKGLIVTTASDATNLYVVLTARLLNPKLFIAARAVDERTVPKMTRAGANRAISPYAIGGRRLAHLLLSPRVVDFFETALRTGNKSLNIGDIVVGLGSAAADKTLAALQVPQKTGATLLAVLRTGKDVMMPRGDLELEVGDHLLALGTAEQLEALEMLATPVSREPAAP